jgi:hypothetical protein
VKRFERYVDAKAATSLSLAYFRISGINYSAFYIQNAEPAFGIPAEPGRVIDRDTADRAVFAPCQAAFAGESCPHNILLRLQSGGYCLAMKRTSSAVRSPLAKIRASFSTPGIRSDIK